MLASAGLFLLGHMALPSPKNLATISGDIARVGVISRKGMGSFYELTVTTPQGEQDRVLIARAVAPEPSIRALIGHAITAEVNSSSEAVQFQSAADPGTIAGNVRAFAEARNRNFNLGGVIALAAGLFLALSRLFSNMRRLAD